MKARRNRTPRGVALLVVVGCLAVMVLVFGALIKVGIAERQEARAEETRLRAAWLAESGLERAWAKLAEKADYSGETWELPAETLQGHDAAVVHIAVESVAGKSERRRVTARADYPRDGTSRARQTRVVEMNIIATASGDSR